jgi:hypothetical protein
MTAGSILTLLCGLMVASHLFLLWRYSVPSGPAPYYARMSEADRSAYEGMPPGEVDDLLHWTWTPGWVYEPLTGFREAPRASRFINVSQRGVRATRGGARDLGPVAPETAIYVFGGSTTFGYGVPDSDTIASHLQAIVPGAVIVNLGRGYYYSAQENVLLMKLLYGGTEVRRAVFVDGLNEKCAVEAYQDEFGRLFADAQRRISYRWQWREQVFFPLQWMIERARERLAGPGDDRGGTPAGERRNDLICSDAGTSIRLRAVVKSNLAVRDALCRRFGISCLTVLQPFAGVHGRHLNPASLSDERRALLRARFDEVRPAFLEAHALDATDALDGVPGHVYVDNVHYSKRGSQEIAKRIAASLVDGTSPGPTSDPLADVSR